MKSSIRLFKVLPIDSKKKRNDKELFEKTVKLGFVFAPEVIANYPDIKPLIKEVSEVLGLSAGMMNSTFHKSWQKVAEASMEQLVTEQLFHYMTTYGFERMGIYDSGTVFIPREDLEIPDLKVDQLSLIVIRGATKKELKARLLNLLGTGIAVSEDTKQDILDVAMFVGFEESDMEFVKNKEVKAALYDYFGLVPKDPTEFLRYIVYKLTGETLLIKNKALVAKIKAKESAITSIVKPFEIYEKENNLIQLSKIFYRFKPIFLALRQGKKMKVTINQIRRMAVKHHVPMQEDFLNSVTAKVGAGEKISVAKLESELDKVNAFRKIRLAYALQYRTKDVDSILYRVRNGKGYATEFSFDKKKEAQKALDVVVDSIVKTVKQNVGKKKVYYPTNIEYALPATEKQFTGVLPSGSYVTVKKDMIVGVNWHNVEGRIDLDLSMTSPNSGKIGWDRNYRTDDRDILFSGDMTDASGKDGASESFYLKHQKDNELILCVNYYNFVKENEVPFKIFVASDDAKNFGSHYTADRNSLVIAVDTKMAGRPQKVLGLIVTTANESRFYFAESNVGESITVGSNDYVEQTRKFLFNYYKDAIYLRDVLKAAKVKFVDDKEEADIDLSPESLTKDSIIDLIKTNETSGSRKRS